MVEPAQNIDLTFHRLQISCMFQYFCLLNRLYRIFLSITLFDGPMNFGEVALAEELVEAVPVREVIRNANLPQLLYPVVQ